MLRERNHEHAERRELRCEGFGRGNADFWAGTSEHYQVRLAHQRTFGRVADRERRQVTGLLGKAQGRKRVGRLAGLRDGDEQRTRWNQWIAIAVFTGNVYDARNPANLFNKVASDSSRVIAG